MLGEICIDSKISCINSGFFLIFKVIFVLTYDNDNVLPSTNLYR